MAVNGMASAQIIIPRIQLLGIGVRLACKMVMLSWDLKSRDNANKQWIYSNFNPNIHINKNYNCDNGGGGSINLVNRFL